MNKSTIYELKRGISKTSQVRLSELKNYLGLEGDAEAFRFALTFTYRAMKEKIDEVKKNERRT
jgi:hypothetical protein